MNYLRLIIALLIGAVLPIVSARADDPVDSNQRPKILFNRWQEDWSALANQNVPKEPFDEFKYIPLNPIDRSIYLSFGLTLRECFESVSGATFGVGNRPGDSYLLHRLQVSADLHLTSAFQMFVQLEDVRAPFKAMLTPVDADPLDLRQAFIVYTTDLAGGTLKTRVGRQEMSFDLQRFVSVRDGPNVQQAYDAAWVDWEREQWRVISFWSHPVQYQLNRPFDDYSNNHFQYGGIRIERKGVGPGELSAYYSRYDLDNASFLFANGDERRDNFDIRYAGKSNGFDWDLEAMGQGGHVGTETVHAWAIGTRAGYTFTSLDWTPRLGVQFDAASGNRHPGNGELGTFNPLFPNGYYFTLAGFTGYTNLVHLKPSLTIQPTSSLTIMTAIAFQWRETTADAVYVQPDTPVPGTAGKGGRWSGVYGQIRADWAINANLSAAVEAVRYEVGEAIQKAGGHNADYLGVELKYQW